MKLFKQRYELKKNHRLFYSVQSKDGHWLRNRRSRRP